MRQSIALSQSSSFASTSSSSSAQASRIPPNSSSFSHSYPPTSYIYLANQTWPPIPTTETDLTTPSLCSDNDHEKEDTSLDDRIPSTPPNTQTRQALRENSNREIIDVDMEADDGEHPIQPKSVAPRLAVSPIRRLNDVFEKRPPSSPMPAPSPHRPRPPARSSGKTSARSGCDDDRPEDEDPLPLFDIEVLDPPQSALSPAPSCDDSKHVREPSVIRSETSSRSSRNQRRQTLDQELRDAEERSAAQEDGDFEDIVYIGVGTKSKRQGFLAHGGAGGASVFMGVGYVEGAGEEEGEASWAEY